MVPHTGVTDVQGPRQGGIVSQIRYQTNLDGIDVPALQGPFFVGWLDPPTVETHLEILRRADHVVLALEDEAVVGFATAISDRMLTAYIPLVEVAERHQGRGIGKELVNRIVEDIGDIYFIDIITDEDFVEFYTKLGFKRITGVAKRNYEFQSGLPLQTGDS